VRAAVPLASPVAGRRLAGERERYAARINALFARDLSPRTLVLVRWVAAPGVAAVLALAGSPAFGVALGVVLFLGPPRVLRHLEEKRRRRLASQTLDLAQALAASAGAGMSLHQALRDAADTLPAPMAQELGAALSRIDAGATVEEALSDLDRRLDLPGFYLVARAVTVAERRGGPLPRLLAKIGRTLQETERVEHRIETETSGVRLASRLMAAMPLLIGVFLYMASPEHVTMLFTTLAGNLVLVVAAFFDWLGFTLIKRLGEVEV
jgi:tight adherence protein B